MPESMQIVIGISAVLIVYLLVMLGTGWWTKKICLAIIRELEEKGAFDAISAVDLPYAKTNFIKIGYRDYRPKALEMLMLSEVVYKTLSDRYYLDTEKAAKMKIKANT